MIDTPLGKPARKLPVEIVVKRSFLYAWESRHALAQPFFIYAAITILAELIVTYFAGANHPAPLQIVKVLEQLFTLSFAVGIHRFVLLHEAPTGVHFFRLDRYFVRYVLVTILLLVLLLVAALPVLGLAQGAGAGDQAGANGAAALFGMVTLFLALVILTRLSLMLPSAAIGDEVRAKSIWEATRGNSFRLLAATLITTLPFLIVELALLRLLPEGGAGGVAAVVTIAVGLVQPVELIVLTTMLALSYDLLVRGNGPVIIDQSKP